MCTAIPGTSCHPEKGTGYRIVLTDGGDTPRVHRILDRADSYSKAVARVRAWVAARPYLANRVDLLNPAGRWATWAQQEEPPSR